MMLEVNKLLKLASSKANKLWTLDFSKGNLEEHEKF